MFQRLVLGWQEHGCLAPDGTVLQSEKLIEGGFASLHLEQQEKVQLYANHQGGYRVRCTTCQRSVAREFSRAVRQWRHGGARSMLCSGCQQSQALEDLDIQPAAAFAMGAVIFRDVASAQPLPLLHSSLQSVWGGYRLVWKRMG